MGHYCFELLLNKRIKNRNEFMREIEIKKMSDTIIGKDH